MLFKDPRAHAATATNSDLILNTQWSLGRISPFIGSKAFDVLKLWSTIRFFGKKRLGQLIDERLELTHAIQSEIEERRPDIVLLNISDINSCMMIFIPRQVQEYCIRNQTRLSDSDLEKLNKLNLAIREEIIRDGTFYVHGFPLKSCPHKDFVDPDKKLYVLRTMNGNPASTIAHAQGLLNMIERVGSQLFARTEYRLIGSEGSPNRLRSVEQKLHTGLRGIFGPDHPYIAVIYGSSALGSNVLLSDIDLMIFVPTFDPARCKQLEAIFRAVMLEEGILIDAEVPFARKLMVTLSLARSAVASGPPLDEANRIQSISKTTEYLASDEMLRRLVFNVLTTPNKMFSASEGEASILGTFRELEQLASHKLVDLMRKVNPGSVNTPEDFVRLACSDGVRSGEEYLGYKMRSNVSQKLASIFQGVVDAESKLLEGAQ